MRFDATGNVWGESRPELNEDEELLDDLLDLDVENLKDKWLFSDSEEETLDFAEDSDFALGRIDVKEQMDRQMARATSSLHLKDDFS